MSKLKNNSRKNVSASIVAEPIEQIVTPEVEPTEIEVAETIADLTPDSTPAVEETPATEQPAVETPAAAPVSATDSFGFAKTTGTSFLLSAVVSGLHTRAEVVAAFLAKFSNGEVADVKAKKTTASVFFSDVKRPIGFYHASRGLQIVTDEATGRVSFTPESVEAAEKAIADGILTDLRGVPAKTKPTKYAAVLAKYGLKPDAPKA